MNSRSSGAIPVTRLGTSCGTVRSHLKALKDKKGLNSKGAPNTWEDGSPQSSLKGPQKALLLQSKMHGIMHTIREPDAHIE